MKRTILKLSLVIFSLPAMTLFADGDCKELTTVSGNVATTNLNEFLQVGTINLTLTSDKNGRIVFDESGALVGRITSMNETGGSTLDHNIFFTGGSTIETTGDQAQILYPNPTPFEPTCSFHVIETITTFLGTGEFRRASGAIIAEGDISFPPCVNTNSFALSGTVCLK